MEKDDRKKLMQKILNKMEYFPMERVYMMHDPFQVAYHVFSVSILPDKSIRYTLRCNESFVEVTADEISKEMNEFFLQNQIEEE